MSTEAQCEINVNEQTNQQYQNKEEPAKGGIKRPYKQKRNTEQRKPAKFTLENDTKISAKTSNYTARISARKIYN